TRSILPNVSSAGDTHLGGDDFDKHIIEVSFDIDANGILTASAQDKASGKEQRMTSRGFANCLAIFGNWLQGWRRPVIRAPRRVERKVLADRARKTPVAGPTM